jgi:hypothetical protein
LTKQLLLPLFSLTESFEMTIISNSLRWQKQNKAAIAGFSHTGTVANADKKGFVTVIYLIISSIIDADKRNCRKKGIASVLCLMISNTFTLAITHP